MTRPPTLVRLTLALTLALILLGGCATPPRPSDPEPPARPGPLDGAIVPMITCFAADDVDRVDLVAMTQLTEWLCTTRASALFPVSGMGQWTSLTPPEKEAIIVTVIAAANGRKPVLAGVGSATSAEETLALARFADEAGAAGVVVVTPDWLRSGARGIPDQEALIAYYRTVHEAVTVPLVIYDRKAEVLPATLARLATLPRLAGIKYRTADAIAFLRATEAAGSRVRVLSGIEHTTVSSIASGGAGVVGGGSNLFPDLIAECIDAARAGRREEALALQARIIEANDRLGKLGGSKMNIKRLLRDVVGLDRIAVNGRGARAAPELPEAERREHDLWLLSNAGVRPWGGREPGSRD